MAENAQSRGVAVPGFTCIYNVYACALLIDGRATHTAVPQCAVFSTLNAAVSAISPHTFSSSGCAKGVSIALKPQGSL